jgi:O-antigen/teichoic acid export membrane protein
VGTIGALALVLFVGVSLFAWLFLPKSADDIVSFLPIMLAGSVFFAIVRLNSMELAYKGKLRALMMLNGLSAVAAVALPVALLPRFGVLGLECGWLLSQVFAVMLGSVVLARYSWEASDV